MFQTGIYWRRLVERANLRLCWWPEEKKSLAFETPETSGPLILSFVWAGAYFRRLGLSGRAKWQLSGCLGWMRASRNLSLSQEECIEEVRSLQGGNTLIILVTVNPWSSTAQLLPPLNTSALQRATLSLSLSHSLWARTRLNIITHITTN